MTSQQVLDVGTRALLVTAKIAGPFLVVVLGIGVIIGLLQSPAKRLASQITATGAKIAGIVKTLEERPA